MNSVGISLGIADHQADLTEADVALRPLSGIRSFVRREGRMTRAQQRALHSLWRRFGVDLGSGWLEPQTLFGRQAPLVLEIGFGDGESLALMAQSEPGTDYLGVEVHRPGIGHLLLRAEALGLGNLRVICADAVEVLEKQAPDHCLDRVQIFFPDPWPKVRHHKRRLIQPSFIALLAQKIKPGGLLYMVTDCEAYAHSIRAILSSPPQCMGWTLANGSTPPCPVQRPLTKFERRGLRLGHQIWEILVIRR